MSAGTQHTSEIPYLCHVLVCVNDRKNEQKSCGPADSDEIHRRLKSEVKRRWPGARIRVSRTACLGLCDEGPNVLIYPHNLWFSKVTPDHIERILDEIGAISGNNATSDPAGISAI